MSMSRGVTEALAEAQRFSGDTAYKAVLQYVVARLDAARSDLETVSPDKFLLAQGRARALRDLVHDLDGRKP